MLFVILVLVGLGAIAVSMCVAKYSRSDKPTAETAPTFQDAYTLEMARIRAAREAAIGDIRRRRQHAEELLRRLERWRS